MTLYRIIKAVEQSDLTETIPPLREHAVIRLKGISFMVYS